MSSVRVSCRLLGETGLVGSRLGIGLAALGRPAYITLGRERDLGADRAPEELYPRAAQVLDGARAAGVRSIDVARSYGRAEEFLARWLAERAVARDEVVVSSKWGYAYTAGWRIDAAVHEEKELSLSRFRTQLGESRGHLEGWLGLYQIHSATMESLCLNDGELLRALVEGRRGGAYRAVGLTVSGPGSAETIAQALGTRVDDERVFDVVQATFNCLEPALAPTLARAHDAGLGVMIKEAFANGRLTDANHRAADQPMLDRLRRRADALGASVDQVALAFVLAQGFADVVLSGAATAGQLESHLDALELRLDGATREVIAGVAEPSDRYWATRSSLPWT